MNIYFGQPVYQCGRQKQTLEELSKKNLIALEPEELRKGGMEMNAILGDDEDVLSLLTAVLEKLVKLPLPLDALFFDSCISNNQVIERYHEIGSPRRDVQGLLEIVGLHAIRKVGLKNIKYYGGAQQGCTGLFSLIELSRAMLLANLHQSTYACLTGDAIPQGHFYDRKKLNILTSDCASGILVSTKPLEYLFLDCENQTYTDTDFSQFKQMNFILGVVQSLLERTEINPEDIENVFIQNCWPNFWKAIVGRIFKKSELLIQDKMLEYGHAYSSDFVINLAAREEKGAISQGRLQLAIGFGYGLHCAAILFKRT